MRMTRTGAVVCCAGLVLVNGVSLAGASWSNIEVTSVERVSLSDADTPVRRGGGGAGISDSGRYVLFSSASARLVDGDTNAKHDVFLRDRETGTTIRVSISSTGAQADGDSYGGALSSDGRYAVFASEATNLARRPDTNGNEDLYWRDNQAAHTRLVTRSFSGGMANGYSDFPSISADGQKILFTSEASNLVKRDANGHTMDVFIRNMTTGRTRLVGRDSSGTQPRAGSWYAVWAPGGRWVAFGSNGLTRADRTSEGDVYVKDLSTGRTSLVSYGPGGRQRSNCYPTDVSSGGDFVVLLCGTYDREGPEYNVFLADRGASKSELVTATVSGTPLSGPVSRGGQLFGADHAVIFMSSGVDLVEDDPSPECSKLYVRNVVDDITLLIPLPLPSRYETCYDRLGFGVTPSGNHLAISTTIPMVPEDTNETYDVYVAELAFS